MANNQSKRVYACEVQLKSGQHHTLKRYFEESKIESFTDMLFKESGYIEVDTESDNTVKFIKADEIESVTWEYLDSDNYNIPE